MISLCSECAIDDGERIVFFSSEMNLIFSVDKETKVITLLGNVPKECFGGKHLFSDIHKWQNKWIFIPFNAKSIWICSSDFQCWEELTLSNNEVVMKFFKSFLCDEKVILLNHNYETSLCIDLLSKRVSVLGEKNTDYCTAAYETTDGIIYSPCHSGKIYKLDKTDLQISQLTDVMNFKSINSIWVSKGKIFIAPRGEKIFGILDNSLRLFSLDDELFALDMFEFQGYLWIPSRSREGSIKYDYGKNQIVRWDCNTSFIYSKKLSQKYHLLIENGGLCHLFNLEKQTLEVFCLCVENEVLSSFVERISEDWNYGFESHIFGVRDYLAYVVGD